MLASLVYQLPIMSGTKKPLEPANLNGGYMHEEIGATAGAVWKILHKEGELSLSQLKKQTKAKTPVFDWAIGWLARENKIAFTQQNRSIRVRLI